MAGGAIGAAGQQQGQGSSVNPFGGGFGVDSTNTTTEADMTRGNTSGGGSFGQAMQNLGMGGGGGFGGMLPGVSGGASQPLNPGAVGFNPYQQFMTQQQQANPYQQQMQQQMPQQQQDNPYRQQLQQPQQMSNVNDMYTNLLGRAADPEGLKFWQSQVDKGMSLADVQKGFTGSDEFKRRTASQMQQPQQQQMQSPLLRGYDGNQQQMPQQLGGLMGLLRGAPQFENNPFGGGLSGLGPYRGSTYRPDMSNQLSTLKNVAPFYTPPAPDAPAPPPAPSYDGGGG
jgi:hypothetical protein